MKKSILLVAGVVGVGVLYLAVSTWLVPSRQLAPQEAVGKGHWPDAEPALAELVAMQTVSQTGVDQDSNQFKAFWRVVDRLYPSLLPHLVYQVGHSRLYKLEGGEAPGLLFAAHIDVVPAGTDWETNPFELVSTQGKLVGRGVLDDKGSVVALLQAFNHLAGEGVVFKGPVYLVLGHDEELGGYQGAGKLAEYLQGTVLEMALDEGGYVVHNMVPGAERPVALIGTAEKGEASYRLVAKGPGGHSSMPEASNPALRLSQVLAHLTPDFFPAEINGPLHDFMEFLAPELNVLERVAFSNPMVLKPVLMGVFTQSASGSALVRTTIAPTVMHVGEKENAMPVEAEAWVNVRMVPGHTAEEVRQALDEVAAPFGVDVSYLYPPVEASAVSSSRNRTFGLLQQAVSNVFPDALVAPYLMVAQSDGRHYQGIAQEVYRFLPFDLTQEELQGIHGSNEQVAQGAMDKAINFYLEVIVLWNNAK